ncbi:hypothetical protein L246_08965, partial [Salmonella enterica subsp. enterica serovar Worthington str. BCH-5715]
ENELADFGKDIRIVLASADFSKELTTPLSLSHIAVVVNSLLKSAIWLRDKGVDIRCVRLTPYNFKGEVLINAEQII